MLSSDSLKEISNIFCGDTADFYTYKQGYRLVEFFNSNFGMKDVYRSGFPSKWAYVHDKLVDLINSHQIDKFFNIVLGKSYLMQEQSLSEVEADEKIETIYAEFNRIIHRELCKITRSNVRYHLVRENDDLEPIGNGGFTNVYRQKSTGFVVKKLKDDYLTDTGIRSRFKREYNITKSLQDTFGIIQVYTFDEGNSSYTMEYAETTLDKYVKSFDLSDDIKLNCIRQIFHIMTGDPRNSHHIYRSIAEKATNSDAAYRYADAGQLSIFFEKEVSYKQRAENQTCIDEKITRKVFDDEIEIYIYDLSAEKISTAILHEKRGFVDVLLAFMKTSEDHAQRHSECG